MASSERVGAPVARHDVRDVAQLVAAAGAGEPAAWEALVRRFSGMVWGLARAHRLSSADAAEVTESVWLKLLENLGRLPRTANVVVWLGSETRNACLAHVRRTGRPRPVGEVIHVRGAGQVAADAPGDDPGGGLWRAVEGLPVRGRSLLLLVVVEPRLSHAEIATILDMPIGKVRPTLERCLRRVRNCPEITGLTPPVHPEPEPGPDWVRRSGRQRRAR